MMQKRSRRAGILVLALIWLLVIPAGVAADCACPAHRGDSADPVRQKSNDAHACCVSKTVDRGELSVRKSTSGSCDCAGLHDAENDRFDPPATARAASRCQDPSSVTDAADKSQGSTQIVVSFRASGIPPDAAMNPLSRSAARPSAPRAPPLAGLPRS